MAPKKTNIKIKRSKINLYNKKKSKAKRALRIAITVVSICALGVLGYGLGKPLIKYLKDKNAGSPDASALISSIIDAESQSSGAESAGSSGETSAPEPVQKITDKVYYLPENAAISEASLAAELAAAKSSGCSVAAVTLKNTNGNLLYKTTIADVKDSQEVVTGTLTASQIASLISKEGLVPAARINTLMDQTAGGLVKGNYRIVEDQGGGTWHDNRPEKGGKPWLSPFKNESANYIGNITAELSAAGFKKIYCANTRFPAFHNVDITTYLSDLPLTDSAKRLAALWSVASSAKSGAEKNGAEMWIEMSASGIVAENRNNTDAELVADKAKLQGVKVIVIYDLVKNPAAASTSSSVASSASTSTVTSSVTLSANAPAGTSSSATTSTSSTSSTASAPNASGSATKTEDDYTAAKNFAAKAKAELANADFGVRIPDSVTGKALEDVTRALNEAGITIV